MVIGDMSEPAAWRTSDLRLVCPQTKQPLVIMSLEEADHACGGTLAPPARTHPPAIGRTPLVFLREDGKLAYPILHGIPILLAPEALVGGSAKHASVSSPAYAEAYKEMEFYDAESEKQLTDVAASETAATVWPAIRATEAERSSFPRPREVWIDAMYDSAAQYDAYRYLAGAKHNLVLQLGGKGSSAIKFILAGAKEAVVASPMVPELQFAQALARIAEVEDRLYTVACVGEELPFADATFDSVYSGGSLHHTVTDLALPEASRVLRGGGRFAAVEPWRAPLYGIGTRVFGKREANAHCSPLDQERMRALNRSFQSSSVVHHGALLRYPLLALGKFGIGNSAEFVWKAIRLDDALASASPRIRQAGSSVAVLGETEPARSS